jgi:hypothetical protein
MPTKVSLKVAALLAGLGVAGVGGLAAAGYAASPPKQTISEDVRAAVVQMGKSLSADQFSFQARTLRVYADTNGQPLHIAHSMKVIVRRPDKLLIDVTGDDGSTKFVYDGKTMVLFGVDTKRYSSLPVPNTIQGMLEKVMGRFGVDFPLADLLTSSPDKSFLFGVTSGREVNIVTIDGVPCRHLLFSQPPGIELELWVEKNDRALPRRLIVTYRDLPDHPSFVAELFDWNFSIHPSDSEFVFQPPEGAVVVELKPAATKAPAKPKGSKP